MKNFDQILFDRLIDKELEPYHLTRKDILPDDPDWFSRNTMTEKEAEEFRKWALFEIKFCVENVKSYYDPPFKPQESGRHYFWANFTIPNLKIEKQIGRMNGRKEKLGCSQAVLRTNNLNQLGFDLTKYEFKDKDKLLRNCVSPEIGIAILDCARGIIREENVTQTKLKL